MRIGAALLAALFALAAPVALAQPPAPAPLTFENSGAAAAQAPFLRGLSLLHNFEYPRAAAAFREAQAADPGFAMAYWGEAMTYNHPVWMEQDASAARGVLARLGPNAAERLKRARTERERFYLQAVEILYGEGAKEERDRLYSAHMARLAERFPNDVDAQAFYALSLLGLAHRGRDVALYMRSAAVLEPLYPANPAHPGILHYLIHAYDDPAHAPLGLRAARRYGDVAPDAPHARHMTSHIFLALGMWDEVIAANRSADAEVDRLRAAGGQPPASCGHYNEWLVYALYQTRRDGDAAAADSAADACFAQAAAATAGAGRTVPIVSWADMAIRGAVENGRPPRETPERLRAASPAAAFTLAYAELLGTIEAARIRALRQIMIGLDRTIAAAAAPQPEPAHAPRRRAIVLIQAEAWEALRTGRREEGLAILRRAAEAERAMPAEFGPPLIEKPSFELLGDELLRRRRLEEAEAAYQAALALAPGRRLSLRGLGEARVPF